MCWWNVIIIINRLIVYSINMRIVILENIPYVVNLKLLVNFGDSIVILIFL